MTFIFYRGYGSLRKRYFQIKNKKEPGLLASDNRLVEKARYVAFDVFDTLLVRGVVRPIDLFKEIEMELGKAGEKFAKNFSRVRQECELNLRKNYNFKKEISLDEIHQEILKELRLSSEESKRVIDLEKKLESKTLLPNPKIFEFLKYLRNLNKKIIFISDTYFDSQFLQEELLKRNIYKDGDHLFCSCIEGCSKHFGGLFELVLKRLDLKPSELLHIGDNFTADYSVPKKYGIEALHYFDTQQNRYESYRIKTLQESKILGTSRLTRLYSGEMRDEERVIWDTTANVSAPIMFIFVAWIIRHAKALGLRKVFFFSRDGQILCEIGKMIIQELGYDMEAKYLYVSRQALLFPSIKKLDEREFEWILARTQVLTTKIVLKRLNFSCEEFPEVLEGMVPYYGPTDQLDSNGIKRLKEILLLHENKILSKAKKYKKEALAYLEQEEIPTNEFGVVDIGWRGSLQYSLSKMLDGEGKYIKVHGFYLGLRGKIKKFKQDELYGWFSSPGRPAPLESKAYIVPMSELFTDADHGGVIRYEKDSKGISKPVLTEEFNKLAIRWGVKTQQAGMRKFTELAIQNRLLDLDLGDGLLTLVNDLYEEFLLKPSFDEARVYGSYLLAEDQNDSYFFPIAQPYKLGDFPNLLRRKYANHNNEWKQGCIRLSGKGFLLLYKLYNLKVALGKKIWRKKLGNFKQS